MMEAAGTTRVATPRRPAASERAKIDQKTTLVASMGGSGVGIGN